MAEASSTASTRHSHPALQHHFENMEQQREAGTLGMWVFLVTEIMFFGGMFLAYTLYRSKYPACIRVGQQSPRHHARRSQYRRADPQQFHDGMAVYSAQVGKRRSRSSAWC